MAYTFTNASAATTLTALVGTFDAGAGAALLVIYSGSAPATAEASLSGNTVLANIALADPSFTVSGKTATMAGTPKTDSSADATGTASFFRIFTSTDGATPGTACFQGSVGTSGADLNLNTTSLVSGGPVQINSGTITLP